MKLTLESVEKQKDGWGTAIAPLSVFNIAP